jgi:hypothetical protein
VFRGTLRNERCAGMSDRQAQPPCEPEKLAGGSPPASALGQLVSPHSHADARSPYRLDAEADVSRARLVERRALDLMAIAERLPPGWLCG